ncbi:MAG: formate dehydrogenase accessory protein FdhE [Gemmatimonadota bacterium]
MFQRAAWALLHAESAGAALPESGAAEARARFAAGVPLFVAARPAFAADPPFGLLAGLAREAGRAFGAEGAREIEKAARRRRPEAAAALEAALRRDPEQLRAAALALKAPPGLAGTLCELAVSPSLQGLAASAQGVLAAAAWGRGYCPFCAAWPLLGELRQADQGRYLRCGLCGADWPFARLACPFCGESDHRHLRALHVEGEAEFRRAETCDSCRGYVKTLARLAPTPPALLPVEDLATAYLDLLALDAGFGKPDRAPSFRATSNPTAA